VLVALCVPSGGWAGGLPLPVPGFRPAVVVPPRSSTGRRPVVVALHGNFDRPEWNCDLLPTLAEGRAWLLCIRGIPRRDTPPSWNRWTYLGRKRVMAEIDAALAALRARYPGRVDDGPLLLAGFSLGAIYSARFAVARPKRFPLLYLVEGSHKVWSPQAIRRFAKGGGAWTRKEGKNPEGGLNAKGRASLKAQGHDIKPPVSAKMAAKSPKAAARRKSFCARMSGMPGPMKDEQGRPTRKALSLRKWDC